MECATHKMIALAAVLSAFALSIPAATAAGTGTYCVKGPGSHLDCSYQTVAACNDHTQSTQTCVARASTTGMGKSMSKSKSKMK
jgi:hypothetical protein